MEAYRTEDEQVEALKKWWKENGTSTLMTIVIVVGGYFGWQAWDSNKTQKAEAASVQYQQLLQLAMQLEQNPAEAQYATAGHIADTLKTDFADSDYARYAAMMQARLLVAQQDLAGAEAELRWVLDSDPEPALAQVGQLRLARLLYAQGKADEALALIGAADPGAFGGAYEELRGDILQSQGDIDGAREAYGNSLELSAAGMANAPLVQMKLESLPQDAAPTPETKDD